MSTGSLERDPFHLLGDLLDGQFRVEKLVGQGQLSVIYRGRHEGVNAPVAIKCLTLPETLDTKLVAPISETFREGARVHYLLARGHLHIVQSLASGDTLAPRTGQLMPYIVREWLDGRSLAEDFAERAASFTPRTPTEAVALLESAADALSYAHAEGVAHHSLSPRNLFLAKTRGGEVLKVLDFAMTKRRQALANGGSRTLDVSERGLRLMLSSYAAPEQLDRDIAEPCASTDVYVFALVLFEAIAGRPYFPPDMHASEVLRRATVAAPLSSPAHGLAVPNALKSVLVRALAPNPRDRHRNMRAFWCDVRRAVERSSSLPSSSKRIVLRRPRMIKAPRLPDTVDDAAPTLELPRPHAQLGTSPTWRRRVGAPPVAAALRLGLAMTFVIVVVVAATGSLRSARPSTPAVRTARTVADEPHALVLSETTVVRAFDRTATNRALDVIAADLESCTTRRSPRGPGSVNLLIQPNGQITRAEVRWPYGASDAGRCIRDRFLATVLRPFTGPPKALSYSFTIQPP